MAGRDYNHSSWCQACWDGGELFLCRSCPGAYHAECLGLDAAELHAKAAWTCPHHACAVCARGPSAAGGMLFRCEACEMAFCDEHLPEDVIACGRLVDTCDRFVRMGHAHPSNAMFIHCSEECADWAAQGFGMTPEDQAALAPPAGPAWVQPGDEDISLPLLRQHSAAAVPLRHAPFGALKAYLLHVCDPSAPLPDGSTGATALRNVLASDGDAAFAALYRAARAALLRNAPAFVPPDARAALSDGSDGSGSDAGSGEESGGESDGSSDSGSGSGSEGAAPQAGQRASVSKVPQRPYHSWRRRRVPFNAEEMASLVALVAECTPPGSGGVRWALVHAHGALRGILPCRTPCDLAQKWRSLRKQPGFAEQFAQLAAQLAPAAGGHEAQADAADAAPLPLWAAPAPLRPRVVWSGAEVAALRELVAELGEGRWRRLAELGIARGVLLPCRSGRTAKDKWVTLRNRERRRLAAATAPRDPGPPVFGQLFDGAPWVELPPRGD